MLGYVLEYDTSPDKFVAAVLHAFDAALQVHTHIYIILIYAHYILYIYIRDRKRGHVCQSIGP